MNCEETKNLALLVACGEAGAEEKQAVTAHSAGCPACAGEIRALREGLDLLKHAPRETPSADARAEIGAMLLRESSRVPAAPSSRRFQFAAAAALLLAVTSGAFAWKVRTSRRTSKNPDVAAPVAAGETARVKTPVDPVIAWTPVVHQDVDDISAWVDAIVPERPLADPDRDWVHTDSVAKSLDDVSDRVASLSIDPEKF